MVGRNRKTRAELEAENRFLKRHRFGEAVTSVIIHVVRWGGLFGIFYWIFRMVDVAAGTTTVADLGVDANLGLRFLGDVRISTVVAWIFGVSGGAYGWRQRTLRRNTIERLQSRIHELETGVDPRRSSSRLTIRGDTRPEDR